MSHTKQSASERVFKRRSFLLLALGLAQSLTPVASDVAFAKDSDNSGKGSGGGDNDNDRDDSDNDRDDSDNDRDDSDNSSDDNDNDSNSGSGNSGNDTDDSDSGSGNSGSGSSGSSSGSAGKGDSGKGNSGKGNSGKGNSGKGSSSSGKNVKKDAKKEQDKATAAVRSGRAVPLRKVLDHCKKSYSGKVLDVKLKERRQRFVYEVRILTPTNTVRSLTLDAKSLFRL